MATIDFQERSIEKVIEQYVHSCKEHRPISTTYTLRAIRSVLPRCGLSDRQLADMVAAFAIRQGRNVAFD